MTALKGAGSALLSALEHIDKFQSRTGDSGTELRVDKYLAARTVNSFSGAHEWSQALMMYAITGHCPSSQETHFGICFLLH